MNYKQTAIILAGITAQYLSAQIATPTIINDYNCRKAELGQVASLPDSLTGDRLQCMQMLYAYMPLPDMTDNSMAYFLDNVDAALQAREEMPWGKIVPDREFRHFVLPVRVNNEALDCHRRVFYNELKNRIKHLGMKDAILEINHWCHEKVTYQPSDGRTHSPLASVSSAIGRCGEESTFTVAALRAMGIPARQVYTPRWAHTDDNHAWVEAWADGQWYFLGACEPEPVLDLGWFNAPAARGMLMHARVFGHYDGDNEILGHTAGHTTINVTSKYAPTDTISVTVLDSNGRARSGIQVSFRIYNYAEFYPIAERITDNNGEASLICGLGDILIWATDGTNFNFKKCSVGKDKNICITVDKNIEIPPYVDFDMTPPAARKTDVEVSDEMRTENNRRMVYEDSVRTAYTASFVNARQASAIANKIGVDPDELQSIYTDARGNHSTITEFLNSVPHDKLEKAISLLKSLTQKDRSDVTLDILRDHLAAEGDNNDPLFPNYIMSPRIDNETLTAFRSFFNATLSAPTKHSFRANPDLLVKWVADSIDATLDWYPTQLTMSPEAVWRYRKTSAKSRDIFFVALARSIGIPARIDPITGKTQWTDSTGLWHDALFSDSIATVQTDSTPQSTLNLHYTPQKAIPDPKYYTHYTISKITDGQPQLLNYPDFEPYSVTFQNPQTLDNGLYTVTSGQRMADGSVLTRMRFSNIGGNRITSDTLIIRQDTTAVQVIGTFDSESLYTPLHSQKPTSVLSTTGRGYFVIGLLKPNHEPTNHALRDIAALKDELENWGRSIILLYDNTDDASRMDMSQLPDLPSNATFGCDINGEISKKLTTGANLPEGDYPIFVIADTFNRVVYATHGYTIGLGQKIFDILHRIDD